MKMKNYLIVKIGEIVLVITVLLFCLAFKVHAQVQLQPSKIFSNGMVLQREIAVPVWGTAVAGAEVTVSINDNTISGVANADGKWKVTIPAMNAGGPFQMTMVSGTKTLAFTNVYIGDVWFASGQSNMELQVSGCNDATAEIAAANNQMIREFRIPKTLNNEPSDIVPTSSAWSPATKAFVGNFSATAYYFAKNLYADLNIPIGIINASYGGSRIEAWMSEDLLGYDENDVEVIAADGQFYGERQPTVCYNQMLKPIEGFPIKGFLWYQGESNADTKAEAIEYGSLFKKMITSWRENWGMGDLPFIWVQLPNYNTVNASPQTGDSWPELRANQSNTLSLPNTGEAITIDMGDTITLTNIHPTNKKPVGERLALVARKLVYHEDIVYSGPRYKSLSLQADCKVVIKFDHIGSGLVAKKSNTGAISGFAMAGSNGVLSWANATISGDSVIVWNNTIKNPSIVRYAWENNPIDANLYNAEGLPAAPFKTYVTSPGFVIKSFNSTALTLERGQTAVLTWEAYGASLVTLNDATVDSISGKMVQPKETTSYTLKITNRQNPEVTTTKVVTIEVTDPKPTISIKNDVGDVTSPGTEITLIATAKAPKERTVKQVDFYIDGVLVGTDETSPYEVKWKPTQAGNYLYTAKVTDSAGASVTSAASTIFVTKLKILVYEAENATITGTKTIKTNSKVSGNKYVDFASQDWALTFDNVEAPEDGIYPLSIRYLLNYQSPKHENLTINGTSLGEVIFEAPDVVTWSTVVKNVTLKKGMNAVEISTSWGWMSFDYISIAFEDTSTVGTSELEIKNGNSLFLKNFPNPVRTSAVINYTLPKQGNVKLEILSADGKIIRTLINEKKPSGLNSVNFDASQLTEGIYFAKIEFESKIETQKIVLIK
jgi:sialate O-acetylesterase